MTFNHSKLQHHRLKRTPGNKILKEKAAEWKSLIQRFPELERYFINYDQYRWASIFLLLSDFISSSSLRRWNFLSPASSSSSCNFRTSLPPSPASRTLVAAGKRWRGMISRRYSSFLSLLFFPLPRLPFYRTCDKKRSCMESEKARWERERESSKLLLLSLPFPPFTASSAN